MSGDVLNLDLLTAGYAQEMVEKARGMTEGANKSIEALERLVTKTLGVLQEQGIYAMILFLHSRSSTEKELAKTIQASLSGLLRELPELRNNDQLPADDAQLQEALKFFKENILNDLDTLLLIRDLYEQTLIYARYGAKAAKNRGA
ncbi:MAG: hypothetical protein IMW93_06020 [Thermoanaerobacteraceae bacterium]|nr:hypothetical protein [Thermoanaerobacteraceae bacterium]